MEAKSEDVYYLTIGLLQNDKSNNTAHARQKYVSVAEEEAVNYKLQRSLISHATVGNTSFFKTAFNGLNALSGVGILSTPYALASGGWLSLLFLFIIALVTVYTALLIQKCMDADPSIRTYPDIGERAFGKKGRLLVSVFMNVELYLLATCFLILEGDNLNNLLPNMGFRFDGFRIEGKQGFVLIVALIILPTILLDNVSILSYISATGVVASFVILGSIFWTAAFEGVGFHHKGELLNYKGIPTAISLYAFSYCAHPVFPTLYTSMGNKKNFSKVMSLCFLLCTITYALIAVCGYLMFGSTLESQITLNLPINKASSKIAIYTTLVNPIAKYALILTPVIHTIENRFQSYCKGRSYTVFIRTSLLISTVAVALTLPFFGLLMSLIGAFLSITASILLPCLCYLKISGAYQRFGLEVIIIGCVLTFGIAVLVIGTYTSLVEIIGQL
ncbi:Vacuolar amino acid transporter 1 [Heracleum sosnowskyi]|uniref:Vacuolar amino acid transporter 1 n=1 Tax=Heracleum sosnowskyi TaxID=360622 RepID=A0AAD8HK54_9APIA|nr:Vacuolar amino acid transporter 1 [Heracleum sosnowskyi]